MKISSFIFPFAFLVLTLSACKPKAVETEEKKTDVHTPVTITTVSRGLMSDSLSLNAVSSFLKKNSLKSSAIGYVRQVNVKIGDYVEQGQVLFVIQTKESSVFKSKALDTLLNFNGQFQIKANSTGIVTEVDKLPDDYVADGEQLCMIAQKNSLVFLLNVPYELNKYIHLNDKCQIELPDKTFIDGTINSRLSSMDAVSQTQNFVVRPATDKSLPESLVARIRITKDLKTNTAVLPKDAVLSDETEENFWVMKLINDSTAIKVPVTKGIETAANVEILAPAFAPGERIILTGQYGLADTASVEIINGKAHE